MDTQSRAALHSFIAALQDVDSRFLSPENRITTEADVALGHRALMHLIGAGLDMFFDADPEHPQFRRSHWAGRKFFGDNADCIYFTSLIRDDRSYRIRGNVLDASYTSFAVEGSSIDERYPASSVQMSLHDKQFDVAPDGSYEVIASPEPQKKNWLKIAPGAGAIVTRHYFERKGPVAGDPNFVIPLSIELMGAKPPIGPPTDVSVAKNIKRIETFIRGLTVNGLGRTAPLPPFVSLTPNKFNPPIADWDKPQDYGATDIVAMMAPYMLKPDEALVIDGRYPKCSFGSVALWNRFMQTYDYLNYQVSLNRKQTVQGPDGGFRMIIAHEDPGLPNWINTVGAPVGSIYVRYILPQEAPQALQTQVVSLASLRAGSSGRT